jgi:uncharacterized repeat protein (TIGR01451 family)
VVRVPQLTIDKSFTGNTKGTDAVLGLPAAAEGDVLTYTLAYDLTDGPVTDGVITDVLPEGLEYVIDSARATTSSRSPTTTPTRGPCAGMPTPSARTAR